MTRVATHILSGTLACVLVVLVALGEPVRAAVAAGTFVVSMIGVATLGAADRDQPSHRPFLGLWEGVDVNDGSRRTISIADRDGDGQVEVNSHDTYWTLSAGDRGLEHATGAIRRDGVLETIGLVTCFESGVQVAVTQTYELSRRDDTLLGTPHGTGLTPIILHRVSE